MSNFAVMNHVELAEIQASLGYSEKKMADELGVTKHRYRSLETGEFGISTTEAILARTSALITRCSVDTVSMANFNIEL